MSKSKPKFRANKTYRYLYGWNDDGDWTRLDIDVCPETKKGVFFQTDTGHIFGYQVIPTTHQFYVSLAAAKRAALEHYQEVLDSTKAHIANIKSLNENSF